MSGKRVLVGNSGIGRVVEQQMRNWELARAQHLAEPQTRRPAIEDFICLSRMVGLSASSEVAKALAERLHWPAFDKELLYLMAGDDEVKRRLYETLDHRDLSWLEALASPLVIGAYVADDFFHSLCDTVHSLVRESAAIFVGRGADLILPRGHGLRVWLIASLATRTHSLMSRFQLTEREARGFIEREEAERREFFRRHFHVESTDPTRFDLTLNLDRMSTAEAVDLILAARERRQLAAAGEAGRPER